jgi:hypothetical protein
MTLAQLLAREPRPPGQVLLDALHDAESILTDARTRVMGSDVTVEDMNRFVEAITRAAKLANVAMGAGLMERVVQQRERELELEAQVAGGALMAGLAAILDALVVDVYQREALRQRALTVMHATLLGAPPPDVPLAIEPASPPPVDPEVRRVLEAEAVAIAEG